MFSYSQCQIPEMLLQLLPTCEVHRMQSDTLQASPVVMKVLLLDTDFLLHTIQSTLVKSFTFSDSVCLIILKLDVTSHYKCVNTYLARVSHATLLSRRHSSNYMLHSKTQKTFILKTRQFNCDCNTCTHLFFRLSFMYVDLSQC